jgi:hypothetical protein
MAVKFCIYGCKFIDFWHIYGATTFSITTLSIIGLFATFSIMTHGVPVLSAVMQCRYYLNVMLSVFMLYVVRLSVVAPILQSLRQIFELMTINCYFHGTLKVVKP